MGNLPFCHVIFKVFHDLWGTLYVAEQPSANLTRINVIHSKAIGGIPFIEITFPNGQYDTFVLERYYSCHQERAAKEINCNFIGHLAKDVTSCVGVTGCAGQKMEFTINTKHFLETNKFILHMNGELEPIPSPFKVDS